MIDREARNELADLLERLARREGRLSDYYEAFRTGFRDNADRGVRAIVNSATAYDPTSFYVDWYHEEELTDLRRLTRFLRSDLEYGWPDVIFKKSNAGALGLLSGCGAMMVFFIIVVSLEAFDVGFIGTQIIFAVVAVWVQGHVEQRSEAGELERHRSEGRQFEASPYLRCGDISSGSEDLIHGRRRTRYAKNV